MAHLYHPKRVTEVWVRVDVKFSDDARHTESVHFVAERDGQELTAQLTDTVVSAMHLACAGRSNTAGGQ